MCKSIKTGAILTIIALTMFSAASAQTGERSLGHGQPLTAKDIAAWDIDVRYDGAGLPDGEGTVEQGDEIYLERCAACHGDFGEGVGRFPALFGGVGSLAGDNPERRVGSLWPYAPTLFDYIRRAMPFGDAQSLTVDETYSLTALVLNMNDLWDQERVLNKTNLAAVKMPNREGFVASGQKPDTSNTRCMRDCKGEARIISRAELVNNTDEP